MKRLLPVLCLLLALLLPVSALAAVSVPDPDPDFYATDLANVLADETEGLIILNNEKLYDACGAQIVFVTVDTVGSAKMENYAYTLFNQWGIGSKTKNNGVLVLMSIKDDDYWLMQGKGIQDTLTSGDLDEYAQTYLEPYFARKDYDTGARMLFAALFERVAKIYKADVKLDETLYAQYAAEQEALMRKQEEAQQKKNRREDREDEEYDMSSVIIGLIILIIIVNIVRKRGGSSDGCMTMLLPFLFSSRSSTRTTSRGRSGFSSFTSSSRSSGSSFRSSGSSSSRSSSSFSRSSGFGGHSGGGGGSRGGGAGRHR